MQTITPQEAAERLESGNGVVIDIRGADEFAQGHIPGAIHLEADRISDDTASKLAALKPIFVCASGQRTSMLVSRLDGAAGTNAAYIKGGLGAWTASGQKTTASATGSSVPSLQRQVQITVGIMLVVISTLAYTLWPSLIVLAGAIGLGLLVAGLTGTCALAAVLMKMPWNQPRRTGNGTVARA